MPRTTRNQTADKTTDSVTLDLAFLQAKTDVIPAKVQTIKAINTDLLGIGAGYSSGRRQHLLILADIKAEKEKGAKFNQAAIVQLLGVANFKLFQAFLTDKEKSRGTLTGSQVRALFIRAAKAGKKADEIRSTVVYL